MLGRNSNFATLSQYSINTILVINSGTEQFLDFVSNLPRFPDIFIDSIFCQYSKVFGMSRFGDKFARTSHGPVVTVGQPPQHASHF